MALAAAAGTASAAPDKEERPMRLAEMPAAVQKTARENLRGGAVVKSEKERRGEAVIFEVVVARGAGERFALEIAPDGKLIEVVRGTASGAE